MRISYQRRSAGGSDAEIKDVACNLTFEVIGVHPVDAPEPCHLVEMLVRGVGELDLGEITQEEPGVARDNWQAPYGERLLTPPGDLAGEAPWTLEVDGEVRLAFFFHYLNPGRPLLTPAGEVRLPMVTPRPHRLDFMEYEPVG